MKKIVFLFVVACLQFAYAGNKIVLPASEGGQNLLAALKTAQPTLVPAENGSISTLRLSCNAGFDFGMSNCSIYQRSFTGEVTSSTVTGNEADTLMQMTNDLRKKYFKGAMPFEVQIKSINCSAEGECGIIMELTGGAA